jgi:hypothetical protein
VNGQIEYLLLKALKDHDREPKFKNGTEERKPDEGNHTV